MTRMFFIMTTLASKTPMEILTIDRKLTFHQRIKNMCRKARQKLSALLRFSPYLDNNKRKAIYTTMVKSQLNYYPLVWIFCPKLSNNLINKVQVRALCTTYNDRLADPEFLLLNHSEMTKNQRNLQVLMTAMYEIINHTALPIMSPLFEIPRNYNTNYNS